MTPSFCLKVLAFSILISDVMSIDPRVFSLINVVTFKNRACTGVSSTNSMTRVGTCYSADQCRTLGGMADGTCASGFGVCCVFRLTTCGGTVSRNCSYIQNPGFPNAFVRGSNTNCQFRILREHNNICRVRLDFNNFQIADPVAAACTAENIMVTSPTGTVIPTLCGSLTGQHMYVSTGSTGDLASFALNFNPASNANRIWDIKVTEVECNGFAPPDGCLQYFTGAAGNVKNYNFGKLIRNTLYTNCIRQEDGFCSIQYAVNPSMTPDPFSIDATANIKGRTMAGKCKNGRLLLVGTTSSVFCGGFFNPMDNSGANGAVVSKTPPFNLILATRDAAALATDTGFNLDYTQIPC